MNLNELREILSHKTRAELLDLHSTFREQTPPTDKSDQSIIDMYVAEFKQSPEMDFMLCHMFDGHTEEQKLQDAAIYGTEADQEAAKSAELSAKFAKESNEHAEGANRIAAAANKLSGQSNTIAWLSLAISVFALLAAIIACVVAYWDYRKP